MSRQGEPEQIDRDYVRLLMVMRRFVRDEFDIKVAISESDSASQLLEYAAQSRNNVLQEMGKELREMLGLNEEAAATSGEEKVHYYRGVAQQVSMPAPTDDAPRESARKRIYRGRVVAG